MDFSERLNRANGRLKAARLRVRLVAVGARLYARATLPPPPGSVQNRPYQQRLALGLAANPRGLELAEQQARAIGVALEAGKFDWGQWRGEPVSTVGDWVEKFRSQWSGAAITWDKGYRVAFNKLPQGAALTIELLAQTMETQTEPDTRSRLRAYDAYRQLATLAGLDPSPLRPLRGRYSASAVDPRDLPEDGTIATLREAIAAPGWRWAFGMLAAYGLRGHEVFKVDCADFPTVRVAADTKTGARFCWPLFPEWADRWQLGRVELPPLRNIPSYSNGQLGTKVARFFAGLPINAYDLRHCYARRCLEFGFSPEFGAKMMGHSPEVHCRTYRRWIDEGTYRAIYDRALEARNQSLGFASE